MNIRKLAFMGLFVVGAIVAGTANLQLTAGVILLVIGYNEFKRQGIPLDKIDDEILAELKNVLNRK